MKKTTMKKTTTKTTERLMAKTVTAILLATVVGILPATPGTASAQEQIGCFRGKSMPECKSFWIIEMQGIVPLAQTARTIQSGSAEYPYVHRAEPFGTNVEWNLGHMVNVGDGYAVGALFTVGSGGTDPLTGVKLRGRRWLNKDLSLELEGGLLRSDGGGGAPVGVNGWTSDLRLNIRDQGSFFVRYDGVSIPASSYAHTNYVDPGGTHHGVYVGASAGSVPALVGTGALGLFYVVLFALYAGSD